jgi:hypothetical protein
MKRANDKACYIWKIPKPSASQPSWFRVQVLMGNRNQIVPDLLQGKMRELGFDCLIEPHRFRNLLVRVFRLKILEWALERRDDMLTEGFRWAEISKTIRTFRDGKSSGLR